MRCGDYGYDAPYFPLIFGFLSVAAGLGAVIFLLRGLTGAATEMTLYFLFFAANTSSFLYTTRRGKFVEWSESWTTSIFAATKRCSTWGAAEAQC